MPKEHTDRWAWPPGCDLELPEAPLEAVPVPPKLRDVSPPRVRAVSSPPSIKQRSPLWQQIVIGFLVSVIFACLAFFAVFYTWIAAAILRDSL